MRASLLLLLALLTAANAAAAELPQLLKLLREQPEHSWRQLNLNAFREAWTPEALRARPIPSVDNPGRVISAWGGFAWDDRRGDLWLWGGGHADYAGNEMYRWRGSTLRWERASLPGRIEPVAPATYVAGDEQTPVSAHPYDTSEFLLGIDRFVAFGGGAFNNGREFVRREADGSLRRTGPYLFDPARADAGKTGGITGSGVSAATRGGGMWSNRDLAARFPDFPVMFRSATSGRTTEQGRDVVYVSTPPGLGTDQWLYRYTVSDPADPASDRWEKVGRAGDAVGGQGAGAVDAANGLYVRTGNAAMPLYFWFLRTVGPLNQGRAVRAADLLGAAEAGLVMHDRFGLDYDPVRPRLLLWGGGAQVWSVTTERGARRWKVAREPVQTPQGAPGADVGRGVLGKWKYAAGLDVFIALEDNGNVWAYKPGGWREPSGL
ncbi:MAG: hypothetical protein HZB71_12980 [Betaproteobacteria bacterium]|nr:hypothetical protein [Betaproteobacteria bacterium]